jgi:hypothetical protein
MAPALVLLPVTVIAVASIAFLIINNSVPGI